MTGEGENLLGARLKFVLSLHWKECDNKRYKESVLQALRAHFDDCVNHPESDSNR